jgi:hypothetical protein
MLTRPQLGARIERAIAVAVEMERQELEQALLEEATAIAAKYSQVPVLKGAAGATRGQAALGSDAKVRRGRVVADDGAETEAGKEKEQEQAGKGKDKGKGGGGGGWG